MSARPVFPFTAIVGQERMRLALVLNAVGPDLGGVLIRGERGTAKSTAVRALAALLPKIEASDCAYRCDPTGDALCDGCAERLARGEALDVSLRATPLVELPVGATDDRVGGSIHLERAIREGERVFEPGLLAAANRGVLYVDEVNLLADHIVDMLLDAAAMGRNYVEREGISVSHPARFLLAGTMNPEEGDLRPQLLDRFALAVEVAGPADAAARVEVVRRRIAFERDPQAFVAQWSESEQAERARIAAARERLPQVRLDDATLDLIARICHAAGVEGVRADIAMHRAATALAAYEGRDTVSTEDVRRAAELALPHRQRRQPFDDPDRGRLPEILDDLAPLEPSEDDARPGEPSDAPRDLDGGDDDSEGDAQESPPSTSSAAAAPARSAPIPFAPRAHATPGRRATIDSGMATEGRPAGTVQPSMPPRSLGRIALAATLRAAAPHQRARRTSADEPAVIVRPVDLVERVREMRAGSLVLFVVDASGSMGAHERMRAVKGVALSLLLDSYQQRDRVGLITFRGATATLVLPPTSSVEQAARRLRDLPTGGRTPLSAALRLAHEVFAREHASRPGGALSLVLVSDGRPNVAASGGDPRAEALDAASRLRAVGARALVVDTEAGRIRAGFNAVLARALDGDLTHLDTLVAETLEGPVRRHIAS